MLTKEMEPFNELRRLTRETSADHAWPMVNHPSCSLLTATLLLGSLPGADPVIVPTAAGSIQYSLDTAAYAMPGTWDPGQPQAKDIQVMGVVAGHVLVQLPVAERAGLHLERLSRLSAAGPKTCYAVLRESPAALPNIVTHQVNLRLQPGRDPDHILARTGSVVASAHTFLPNTWRIVADAQHDPLAAVHLAQQLSHKDGVVFAEPILMAALQLKGDPSGSPLYGPGSGSIPSAQWHLNPALGGNHLNVRSVWDFVTGANLGAGVVLNLVDDGVGAHPGFGSNLASSWGWSFRSSTRTITLESDDNHGTFCAGIAGGRDGTGLGVGVAPRVTIVPVQMSNALFVSEEIVHNASASDPAQRPWISSCSWGVPDSGDSYVPMNSTYLNTLTLAATSGRSGRGALYCVAIGNGRDNGDNANYDDWATSPFTIGVGATNRDARQTYYSEDAAGLMVCAPGGESPSQGMASLDRTGSDGYSDLNYTLAEEGLQGTSFSTPAVAGGIAVLLSANPKLGRRDILHLLANHSAQIDPSDNGVTDPFRRWQRNNSGGASGVRRSHSVRYGFGQMDLAKCHGALSQWVMAPVAATPLNSSLPASAVIPAGGNSAPQTFTITSGTAFVTEHVQLTLAFAATSRGDISFSLVSPRGTLSHFARRPNDSTSTTASTTFVFTSVSCWGEDPVGTWTLTASNAGAAAATLVNARLNILGYAPYPTPTVASVFPANLRVPATGSTVQLIVTLSGQIASAGNGGSPSLVVVDGQMFPNSSSTSTSIEAAIPASLLTAGNHTVSVATPVFDSQFTGTPGAYGVVTHLASGTIPLVVSSAGPTPPTITSPAAGASGIGSLPTFSGTADTGTTVTIYEGSTLLGTTVATAGSWQIPCAALMENGLHNVVAFSTDTATTITTNSAILSFTVGSPAIVPPAVVTGSTASPSIPPGFVQAPVHLPRSESGGCGVGGLGLAILGLLVTSLGLCRRDRAPRCRPRGPL